MVRKISNFHINYLKKSHNWSSFCFDFIVLKFEFSFNLKKNAIYYELCIKRLVLLFIFNLSGLKVKNTKHIVFFANNKVLYICEEASQKVKKVFLLQVKN